MRDRHGVEVAFEMDGRRIKEAGRLPGDGRLERKVELHDGAIERHPSKTCHKGAREVLEADEATEEAARGHVGKDRSACVEDPAPLGHNPERAPRHDAYPGDGIIAPQRPSGMLKASDEGVAEALRALFGDGIAVVLPERREQPGKERAASIVRSKVGVGGATGEQGGGSPTEVLLLDEAAKRHQHQPAELTKGVRPLPSGDAAEGPQRGERGAQRVHQVVAERAEAVAEAPPRLAVAGMVRLEGVGTRLRVTPQQDGLAIELVAEHDRRMAPGEPEALKTKRGDRRRGDGERKEGCAGVDDSPLPKGLVASHRPAWAILGLDQDDLPTRRGEDVRRDEPVRARAHDDGITTGHRRPVSDCLHFLYISALAASPLGMQRRSPMRVDALLARKGTSVVTVEGSTTVAAAAAELRRRAIGSLVVSPDGQQIEGIITERDIVQALPVLGASLLDEPVEQLMSKKVQTCRGDDEVESLMATMTAERVRHVPVVDGDGLLAGIVSIGDVVKATIDALQRDRDELVSYIYAR
jgi:CBS domain-containing protein